MSDAIAIGITVGRSCRYLVSTEQCVCQARINIDAGSLEFSSSLKTFEYCDALANTLILQDLVKEWRIARIVGHAKEHLFAVVVPQIPSRQFWRTL